MSDTKQLTELKIDNILNETINLSIVKKIIRLETNYWKTILYFKRKK